jgi:TonB family protein
MRPALSSVLLHAALGLAAWGAIQATTAKHEAARGGDVDVRVGWVARSAPPAGRTAAPHALPARATEVATTGNGPANPADPAVSGAALTASIARNASASAGGSAEGAAARSYLLSVRTRIQARLRYPLALRRRGITGSVQLALTLAAEDGRLLEATLARGSGSAELDELALAAAREAAPFGHAEPMENPGPTLRLTLPILFRIGENR